MCPWNVSVWNKAGVWTECFKRDNQTVVLLCSSHSARCDPETVLDQSTEAEVWPPWWLLMAQTYWLSCTITVFSFLACSVELQLDSSSARFQSSFLGSHVSFSLLRAWGFIELIWLLTGMGKTFKEAIKVLVINFPSLLCFPAIEVGQLGTYGSGGMEPGYFCLELEGSLSD